MKYRFDQEVKDFMKLWEHAMTLEKESKGWKIYSDTSKITYETIVNHRCISMYRDLDSIEYLYSKYKYHNCHWDENGLHRSCEECWNREYKEQQKILNFLGNKKTSPEGKVKTRIRNEFQVNFIISSSGIFIQEGGKNFE